MTINILMAYTDMFQEMGHLCEKNTRSYCEKHGYGLIVERDGFDPERHPSWSKLLFMGKHLDSADWTMWLDSDAFIMNHNQKIEDVIKRFPTFDMIAGIHWTWFPKGEATIHSGAFLVRNCRFIRDYLEECYTDTEIVTTNHIQMEEAALYNSYRKHTVNKNSALTKLSEFCTSVPFVCTHIGGTFEYKKGDFILHISNPMPYADRLRFAKELFREKQDD